MNSGDDVNAKETSKTRRIVRNIVTVAASLLLVFVCIEIYKFYHLSPDRLFNESYTAYELTTVPDLNDTTGSKIEKAYHEKNYAAVIKINKSSVLSVKDVFLTGMSYLESNDLPKAISSFQLVIADLKDDKPPELKDAAEYYLALAYLKNNDYDQAIELMNKIHDNPSHLYTRKFSNNYIKRVKKLKWR
jgi:tetratricopeptide (TPR) repeat protein